MKVRITKEFTFETAHALDLYHGKCKDIHGHSYQLKMTLIGSPIEDEKNPCVGMVMDFGDLKSIVRSAIIDKYDHHLILHENSRFKGIEKQNERVHFVPFHPTCENMLIDMVKVMEPLLPSDIKLHSASLRETATSFAEWFASDNN